ncbi:hypothetical protein RJ641_012418, partial [Dillenia turbinata]
RNHKKLLSLSPPCLPNRRKPKNGEQQSRSTILHSLHVTISFNSNSNRCRCSGPTHCQEIEQVNDSKNHQLHLARIKKIMKVNEDFRMISAKAPILLERTRGLQKNDTAAAITRTDIFYFLVDILPRYEIKDEAARLGLVGSTASGVPYYYPPMGRPAPPGL